MKDEQEFYRSKTSKREKETACKTALEMACIQGLG